MNDYGAWRPALIAFYQRESPWMSETIAGLKRGDPLTADNRRVIDGLIAASEHLPMREAA